VFESLPPFSSFPDAKTPMNSMNFRKIPQTYCSAHAVSASALGAARRNKAQLFKTTDAVAR
jgi:hypothetical protein